MRYVQAGKSFDFSIVVLCHQWHNNFYKFLKGDQRAQFSIIRRNAMMVFLSLLDGIFGATFCSTNENLLGTQPLGKKKKSKLKNHRF